jgi:hypothetical protein
MCGQQVATMGSMNPQKSRLVFPGWLKQVEMRRFKARFHHAS